MPTSARTMRRNRILDKITLLAIVTTPTITAPDRRYSEHPLCDGMLITCHVDGNARRVFKLLVQGTPVLRLFEGDAGDAIGFARDGYWNLVIDALVGPWSVFLGEHEPARLAPERRVHSTRSPYAARGSSRATAMPGPAIVLLVAQYVASVGEGDPVDGNVMGLMNELGGFDMKIIRMARDIILLVDGIDRTQLVGVLQRNDLDRPGEIRHRVASPWLNEMMNFVRADAARIDPADLVAFASAGT